MNLRAWQKEAGNLYASTLPRHFLCEACVGAGKTTYALAVARKLREARIIKHVIIIVPTDHLRTQWAISAERHGLQLDTSGGPVSNWIRNCHGHVATYAQIVSNPRRYIPPSRNALVILDEVHHAGEGAAYGDAVTLACSEAKHVLSLSGTPFRSDDLPIPFITYENGLSRPDYRYGLPEALADQIVRPVAFMTYGGEIEYEKDGIVHSWDWDTHRQIDLSPRLRAALNPDAGWLTEIIRDADDMLTSIRRNEQPDAGGLIVCLNQEHARQVAELVHRVTGRWVDVAVSDDADASRTIQRFADGTSPWLVTVRMVSEGVDIPRLRVGVFATNYTTRTFFVQFTGRLMRVRPGENPPKTSYCYMPKDPRLMARAREIQQAQRHFIARQPEQPLEDSAEDAPHPDDEPMELPETAKDDRPTIVPRRAVAELRSVVLNGQQLSLFPHAAAQRNADELRGHIQRRMHNYDYD